MKEEKINNRGVVRSKNELRDYIESISTFCDQGETTQKVVHLINCYACNDIHNLSSDHLCGRCHEEMKTREMYPW